MSSSQATTGGARARAARLQPSRRLSTCPANDQWGLKSPAAAAVSAAAPLVAASKLPAAMPAAAAASVASRSADVAKPPPAPATAAASAAAPADAETPLAAAPATAAAASAATSPAAAALSSLPVPGAAAALAPARYLATATSSSVGSVASLVGPAERNRVEAKEIIAGCAGRASARDGAAFMPHLEVYDGNQGGTFDQTGKVVTDHRPLSLAVAAHSGPFLVSSAAQQPLNACGAVAAAKGGLRSVGSYWIRDLVSYSHKD